MQDESIESKISEPKSKRLEHNNPSTTASSNKIALNRWYDSVLSSYSTTKKSKTAVDDDNVDGRLIQCVCGTLSHKYLIECSSCGKYQHTICLG